MLYRENEILIFDEPTAVLTPQEIDELMKIMKNLAAEGKSILFISHKLNEIMSVADRVTVLRKGQCIGTVETKDTNQQALSNMMVGRPVQLEVIKSEAKPGGRRPGREGPVCTLEASQERRCAQCHFQCPRRRDRLHRRYRRQRPERAHLWHHWLGENRRRFCHPCAGKKSATPPYANG